MSLGTPKPRIQTRSATAYMTSAATRVRLRVRRACSTAALTCCVTSPETLAMRRILRQANRLSLPFMEEASGQIRLAGGGSGRETGACGSCGCRRGALRAAGRPGAAGRRVVPGRRGRQGRAGRRQRRRQDHAAADHHRRPGPAGGRGHPLGRPRRDAPDGRRRARRGPDGRRPAALGGPAAGAGRGAEVDALRAGADGDRRREDPDAVRRGAGGVRRRRRLRHRGRLGRVHDGGAGRALRPGEVPLADARCPAASRSGWCWSTCSRGPDEVLLLDEPDNFLDVPGKIWLEERITRVGEDDPLHQPRPGAARQHRDPGGHRRARQPPATWCGRTRAASRRTTRRGGTGSRASRSCASAGTRSTPSSAPRC